MQKDHQRRGETLLARVDETEIERKSVSELTRQELEQLYSMDDYCFDRRYFPVMGKAVEVHDRQIAEAFQKLSEKKREILLMLYFLDMTETEIASYLHLVQSTIHYHKKVSLNRMRQILEEMDEE